MKKIILNSCYGGYRWSNTGIIEVLKRKGAENIRLRPLGKGWKVVYATLDGEDQPFQEIDREDPVGIAVLEEKGPDFCSGWSADLVVEEYDDENFVVFVDDEDGLEFLRRTPRITEKRIRACHSVEEIIDLLRRFNLLTDE